MKRTVLANVLHNGLGRWWPFAEASVNSRQPTTDGIMFNHDDLTQETQRNLRRLA